MSYAQVYKVTKLDEGLQYVSVSIKGAIGLIILNFVAFVYVKAKERM